MTLFQYPNPHDFFQNIKAIRERLGESVKNAVAVQFHLPEYILLEPVSLSFVTVGVHDID
jgi:hypothetical protein